MQSSSLFWILLSFVSGFVEGIEEKDPVSVKLGKTQVILSCIARDYGISEQNVKWYKDRTPLTAGEYILRDRTRLKVERKIGSSEWNLKISNIVMTDAALYTCKVGNTEFTKVRLRVKAPPEIVDHESSAIYEFVNKGSTLELKCKAKGDPEPTITWYRKAQFPYSESDLGKEVGVTGNILRIRNVTRYGGDVFVCEARNSLGSNAREMNVTVRFPPEVIVLEDELEADIDLSEPVIMTCIGQGSPLGDVYWWKDLADEKPSRIYKNYFYEIFSRNEPGYPVQIVTLMVRRIENRQFGDYHCRAEGFDIKGEGAFDDKIVMLKQRGEDNNEETTVPYS